MAVDRLPRRMRPGLVPIEPALLPVVLRLVHLLLPLLLRLRLFPWLPAAITRVEVVGGERLARCWAAFASGGTRLILAFRHGEVDDPLVGLQLLARELPRQARRLGVPLPRPLHAQFLFDRGMPLWGGRPLGWLLGRLGGVSVRRGRQPDWTALRRARHLVLEGPFPFAMAPEGATNGHGETIGPLEPGVVQLGLWALDDLRRAGRREEVVILPVAIQYVYARRDWRRLERLLGGLERAVGLSPPGTAMPPCARLGRIGETLMTELEDFLGLPSAPAGPAGSDTDARLARLLDGLLADAESRLGLVARGGPEARCRRIEEAVWCRRFRDDLPPRRRLPALRRALADWTAHEAGLAELRMRLAECFVAVSAGYVPARPSFERHMELALLLHDALARLRGDRLPARPRLGARHARVSVGAPIPLGERLRRLAVDAHERKAGSRRSSRRLIDAVSAEIRHSFESALI
jgi:1-acyl-sn-glycerol-3-phosphate acyltransferase